MNALLYIIIIFTGWLIYKIINSISPRSAEKKRKRPIPSKCSGSHRFKQEAITWCTNLLQIQEKELRAILDKIPAQYTCFSLRKRSGGFRQINVPSERLMAVQQNIYHRILISAPVHPAAMGFRQGISISENARAHLGKQCILKVDLHDFFPSIRYTRVRDVFEQMGYPHPIARTLAELCCLKRKLPQGAPTSPALSNIIAISLDKKMAALARNYGLVYTRYADDLTFSGDSLSKDLLLLSIQQIVEEEGFTLNRKKIRFLSGHKRKIITGVSISSGVKLTIPRAKKREIRKAVHFILAEGLQEHQVHIGSTDPAYLKRILGYLAYWHSIEPDNRYVMHSMAELKRLKIHGYYNNSKSSTK